MPSVPISNLAFPDGIVNVAAKDKVLSSLSRYRVNHTDIGKSRQPTRINR
jgi:hypothetical protein